MEAQTAALPDPIAPRGHLYSLVLTSLIYLGLILAIWLFAQELYDKERSASGLLAIGTLGICRYGWLLVNLVRSYFYRFYTYPRLRKAADAMEFPFPERLHFIIPTYQEKPWVTRKMLTSVTREAASLPCPVHLYITTGGPEEDAVVREGLAECHANPLLTVHMMRQSGKRNGMAFALRAAARMNGGEPNSVVVLMDGDTLLGPGILRKSLPFFSLLPKVGGLTTNNIAITTGPNWYRRWYALRFALRNRYMCSTSLSHKVLTLTGRFSFIRGDIALSDEFIERVETDSVDDWMYGKIEFKTGDDKSTWYTLLRNGWDMLYLPDTYIYCLENAGEKPFRESVGKMRRWFGNMLRNNGRALALGPQRIGAFTWLSLLDQRISMWTSLVLPTAVLMLIFSESPMVLLYFTTWVLATRLIYLSALAVEGHQISVWDLPLLLYQQWVGSFIKIQTLSDLRRQKWGAARGDAKNISGWFGTAQTILWLLIFALLVGVLVVG
jgi:glycosyltransferase Alg8